MKPLTALLAGAALCLGAFSTSSQAELAVGSKAPEFSLPAWLAGEPFTFDLDAALKKGPVVLYFFPAPHTSGCNVEAHLFSQSIDRFKALHATVVGVTAGNLDQIADFSREAEHCSGKFAVAADKGAVTAKAYDSVLTMKPDWSNRTSYLIDPSGRIVAAYSAMSPKEHVSQMLAALEKLPGAKASQ